MCSSDSRSDWTFHLLAVIGLTIVVGGAYAAGMDIPYYADDFELYFPALDVHWSELFWQTSPAIEFYRPFQNVLLALIQSAVGMWSVPVHVLTLVLHLAVVGLVYEGARWLGASRRAALLAAVTMGVAQANTAAVLGNDTLSQVGTTFFGYLGLRLYGFRRRQGPFISTTDGFVLLALVSAFLFKEAGVAFVLPIVVLESVDGLRSWRAERWRAVYRSGLRTGGVLLLTGGYLAWRAGTGAVSPGIGGEPYQYWFGMNLVRNAALFGAAAATVVPTTSVALWTQVGAHAKLVGAVLGMGALGAGLVYGLVRGNRLRLAGGLLLLAGLSLAPVLPLNNVSELYVYAAMPPLSILVGLAFDSLLSILSGWKQIGSALLIGAYFFGQVWSVRQKSALMERTGERTQAVLSQLVDVTQAAPANAVLCLRDESAADTTAYSIYRMPGASSLQFAGPVIRHRAQSPDVTFEVGPANCQQERDELRRAVLQFRVDGWKIERVSAADPRK